jgi:zinc and cadmium transporter
MNVFLWIFLSSILMSLIALVGSLTLLLQRSTLDTLIHPMVAFAAGTMLGSALFHMVPTGMERYGHHLSFFVWIMTGFAGFFAVEQLLHWHHAHLCTTCKKPMSYLILVGDGVHNFIGGLAIAGTFLVDIKLGIMSWLAAAAHEVPQELGDFAVLIHSGWSKGRALFWNLVSALTFLAGGLITYAASRSIDIAFLLPVAAGIFLYVAASDLVPEVNKHETFSENILHLGLLLLGAGITLVIRVVADS